MPSHLLPRVGIYVPVIIVFGAVPRKGRVDLGVAFPQPFCGVRLIHLIHFRDHQSGACTGCPEKYEGN